MRRRTISIDCCTAAVARSFSATGDSVTVEAAVGLGGELEVRLAGARPGLLEAIRSCSAARGGVLLAGLVDATSRRFCCGCEVTRKRTMPARRSAVRALSARLSSRSRITAFMSTSISR